MSKSALDRSVLDIIEDPECGIPDDKLRLFLIYYICSSSLTEVCLRILKLVALIIDYFNSVQAEADQYEAALRRVGCDLEPLQYLKRWKYVITIPNTIT